MNLFSSSDLFKLLKPENNPALITDYGVIIGGTINPANMEKGAIILHPISSKPASSQFKDFTRPIEPELDGEKYKIREMSVLELVYQCDIYKVNDLNVKANQAENEAHKIREFLSGIEATEYLAELNAQILPIYSPLRFSSEILTNQMFANRVSFDFTILSLKVIKEWVDVVEKVIVEKQIIF